MIEQISAFFTIEMIYMWLNIGVLPFWFILIFFPSSRICNFFVSSIFPFIVLSAIYSYLFYDFFISGYNFLDNFKLYLGLDNLRELFVDSSFLIIFWTHFKEINFVLTAHFTTKIVCYNYGIDQELILIVLKISLKKTKRKSIRTTALH